MGLERHHHSRRRVDCTRLPERRIGSTWSVVPSARSAPDPLSRRPSDGSNEESSPASSGPRLPTRSCIAHKTRSCRLRRRRHARRTADRLPRRRCTAASRPASRRVLKVVRAVRAVASCPSHGITHDAPTLATHDLPLHVSSQRATPSRGPSSWGKHPRLPVALRATVASEPPRGIRQNGPLTLRPKTRRTAKLDREAQPITENHHGLHAPSAQYATRMTDIES